MCVARNLMTYLVASDSPATTAKTYQPSVPHGSLGGCPTSRRINATPLPVSIALAGHTNAFADRKVSAISMTAQVRIAEDLRDGDAEAQRHLAEHVDRDDHRSHVQPRIADAGQHQRVRVAAQGQRTGGHWTGGNKRSGVMTVFVGYAA